MWVRHNFPEVKMHQTMINRIPVHLIYRPQNHFHCDNMHLLQLSGEGFFLFYQKDKKSVMLHIPVLYLSLSMYNISRRICIVFVREQLCNKLKKVTEEQQKEIPEDLKASRQSVEKVQQPKQPTAGDNIVSNYFHPYWAEDLSVVCFSVISGPAAHLILDCIGSVKHQREGGGISGPRRGAG